MAMVRDPKLDPILRGRLAYQVGGLGEAALDQGPGLLAVVTDRSLDPFVRSSAVEGLGWMGQSLSPEAFAPYGQGLIQILRQAQGLTTTTGNDL